jgi:hypothetical protein
VLLPLGAALVVPWMYIPPLAAEAYSLEHPADEHKEPLPPIVSVHVPSRGRSWQVINTAKRQISRSPLEKTNIRIGIAVGVVLGVFLAATIAFLWTYRFSVRCSRKRRKHRHKSSSSKSSKAASDNGGDAPPAAEPEAAPPPPPAAEEEPADPPADGAK